MRTLFDPGIPIGETLTEKEVHDTFQCQTTFGIRMSRKNNLFVIMSGSAKKRIYEDEWRGDVLHYIGTDSNSDSKANQTLELGRGNNNRQLYDVWRTDEAERPQIFLFTKQVKNACVYRGEVTPDQEPYMKPRFDDPTRMVWVFPLRLKPVDTAQNHTDFLAQEHVCLEYDTSDLKEKAERASLSHEASEVVKHQSVTSSYERDPSISALVKLRANGICDLCRKPSPFADKKGRPFLEVHHVIWLSRNGVDSIRNAVALCPNCHRKMHILDDPADVLTLEQVLHRYGRL